MLPRKGNGDDQTDVYTQASGYCLRDFDLSRETEFNNPEDHPTDWKDFECLLGNCCDRLLRDIDGRFKDLAEYLWDKIEVDGATPEVIQRAFQNNLDQIDHYLTLQFDYAKEQLELVMRSNRSKAHTTPSSDSAGFSTPSSRSSGTRISTSGTNPSSQNSGLGSKPSSRSSRTDTNTTDRTSRSYAPETRSRTLARSTLTDSDSASYASADDGSLRSPLPGKRKRRSSGGDTRYSDPGYRDGKTLSNSTSRLSVSSICRRALNSQASFGAGLLAGITAVLALIALAPYIMPYLPAYTTHDCALPKTQQGSCPQEKTL